MDGPNVVAVVGPTAAGKSALGLALAERLGGEIVCCDSMQVYRGMDVGTGKATAVEQAAIPHHLLDLVAPDQPFSAATWAERARAVLRDIAVRGRLPIIVGGTGLYFRALVHGLFEAPPADPAIRARHEAEARTHGVASLYRHLHQIDPATAATVLPGDLVRISRALEVWEQTGIPISELRRRSTVPAALRLFAVILDPPLPELRRRIFARVETMMATGFLDEVRGLRAAGHGACRALQALGYRPLGQHLDGRVTLTQAVDETKRTTVAYARRQRTWFRKETAKLRVASPPEPRTLADDIVHWQAAHPARVTER